MENNLRQKECIRMLSVSGFLHTLANYGELEVSTSEDGVKFITDVVELFGMECKVEKQEDGYKIFMKDSMWGHWRSEEAQSGSVDNHNEQEEKKTFDELMDMGYEEEEADNLVKMQEDRLFIGAKVRLAINDQMDELIDRNLEFYSIQDIEWESNVVFFDNTEGVARFNEILPFESEENRS